MYLQDENCAVAQHIELTGILGMTCLQREGHLAFQQRYVHHVFALRHPAQNESL